MRTTLFLSTLFAVTLAGGAAFAEKPPKSIERVRTHGDVVDKQYRGADKAAKQGAEAATPAQSTAHQAKSPIDKGDSRVNCSAGDVDCAASSGKGDTKASSVTVAGVAERTARMPAFMDKIAGSDRTNFNEAGEDQGMSNRAANRAWAKARGSVAAEKKQDGERAEGRTVAAAQAEKKLNAVEKKQEDTRTAAGDAEDYYSSKAAKRVWATEAAKAGTWRGPVEAKETAAAKALRKIKEEKTESQK